MEFQLGNNANLIIPSESGRQIITPPTVGRQVWYRPSEYDRSGPGGMTAGPSQPLVATVIAVWGDRMVNLNVIDAHGHQFYRPSTTLVQDGDPTPSGSYCEWPHQAPVA